MLVTLGQAVDTGERLLAKAGIESAHEEAEVLLGHVLRRKPLTIRLAREEPAPAKLREQYLVLVRDRARRRPLAYVTGVQEFMGLSVEITPAVLVPRCETEVLVEAVVDRVKVLPGPPVVVDVGTGSGAIALSLARALPSARVFATDVSASAVTVARRNAARLGLSARLAFAQGDLLTPLVSWSLDDGVHALVANLPYIPTAVLPTLMPEVSEFEPPLALDGGPDGLSLIRRFLEDAPRFLRPAGIAALEIGWDQADAVRRLLAPRPWIRAVEILKDLDGHDRVVIVHKQGSA